MTRASAYGLTTPRKPDWRDTAACAGLGDLMFPSNTGHEISDAKAVCSDCPAIRQCRTWALGQRIEYGVWGGLSEKERALILRRRGRGTRGPRTKTAA